ncbi:MAG TPA: CapA family protein [Nitrolancea sp.]|nr:CapA family protein [Nitrolancea sp.]
MIELLASAPLVGGVEPIPVEGQTDADLVLRSLLDPDHDTIVLASQPLAPVTSPRLWLPGLTRQQLDDLLGGSITDWAKVGVPTATPVQPVAIGGVAVSRAAPATIQVPDYAGFLALLPQHPGALALAPLDVVDFQAGSPPVDDVRLLAETTPTGRAPLALALVATGSGPVWEQLKPWLAAQSGALAGGRPAPTPLTVTFSGDVILGRTVHTIISRLGDFAAPFRKVADELKGADLTILDLECTLSDTITPPTDPYTFSFMTRAAAADGLVLAGVDAVSQANNHSMNFGADGMRDTLAALDARKILHFGIGEQLSQARQPVILQAKGVKLALLGFDGITGDTYGATGDSAGTSPLVADNLVADIQAVRPKADLVIPFIHWGVEYTLTPTDGQVLIAHQAIDAGADMVVGSHPHWVQGVETYHGRPIVYSLGNFVFDQEWSLETKQGLIMHLIFRGRRLAGLRFVPIMIEDYYQPRLAEGDEISTILDRVWRSSDILAGTA